MVRRDDGQAPLLDRSWVGLAYPHFAFEKSVFVYDLGVGETYGYSRVTQPVIGHRRGWLPWLL